jgi:hypothetical protein
MLLYLKRRPMDGVSSVAILRRIREARAKAPDDAGDTYVLIGGDIVVCGFRRHDYR